MAAANISVEQMINELIKIPRLLEKKKFFKWANKIPKLLEQLHRKERGL